MEIKENENGVFFDQCDVIVRRSVESDVQWLADNLCQSDIDEAWAVDHSHPRDLLGASFVNSVLCLTIEHKGLMVGMFGVLPNPERLTCGTVWFIATDELKNIGKIFLRNAKSFMDLMTSYYPTLENYVNAKNTKSIIWMRYCGAEMKEPEPFGIEGQLFHYFRFSRKTITTLKAQRAEILALEEKIAQHPAAMIGDCFPLRHSFAKGTYVREISIPKGMIVVSKIHKNSHPVFVLTGDISIYTDEGVKRIKGPCSFISPAGAKRVGVTHEDTVWVTVHATNETDLEKIEEELIAKNFQELDNQTIKNFVGQVLSMEDTCHSSPSL